ncbi:cytoplasmic dynein 2 heavy chain 1 [Rhopalosiphum padi]|uniref:cytoplasmic dynein 2 heavy chain 1 n=1 Tax=Rhopalosiphum padi TaxID=40932 RepID=UPI00298E571A|nr:cytoplasmic dynein 2 heavy chain 1 [Rhopalosiphum padi]
MSDFRQDFIIKTAGNYFGFDVFDKNTILKSGTEHLNAFLNSSNCSTIYIKNTDPGTLEANDKIVFQKDNKIIVFYKTRPESITEDNLHSIICVYSMLDSPTEALYHSLHYIYTPSLLKDTKSEIKLDPKLQCLISDLEMGLKTTILKSSIHQSNTSIESHLGAILDLEDEAEYWCVVKKHTSNKEESIAAGKICSLFLPVTKQLKESSIQDLEECLENVHNCLDDIWKIEEIKYPQARMEHIFEVIGNSMIKLIQRTTSDMNIWTGEHNENIDMLKMCMKMCNKWIKTCEQLTMLYWPNYTYHKWNGPTFLPKNLITFSNHIKEIISILSVNNQMIKLLTAYEQEKLRTSENLKSFIEFNDVSQLNTYTKEKWEAAVEKFEQKLQPAEDLIAGKLRNLINRKKSNTVELIHEFIHYQEIIERPKMYVQLKGELENFLNCLKQIISAMGVNVEGEQKVNVLELAGLEPIVQNLYSLKQQEAKLNDIEKVSDRILTNLNGYEQLKDTLTIQKKMINNMVAETYGNWVKDRRSAVINKSFRLNSDDPVIYFQSNKLMKVNFNPDIELLIREVKMLKILGYVIPSEIEKVSDMGSKFIRQAKSLEQIASFHNTIGDRMISSQRPMMLSSAIELLNLVKQQQRVTWTDIQSVDIYILEMRKLMEKISLENQTLANYHQSISNKIINLMAIDILQEQHQWKVELKSIRDIVRQVEEKFSNCEAWKTHLDFQIYKALNHRYQIGLEALNQHLPDFRIEIVYRQRQLKFNPPIEEIRMKYFSQLKKFISVPIGFRGIVDSSVSIFASIIDRNASKFTKLFLRAEKLFERLENILKEWENRVTLGSIDMEKMIQENIKTAHDWENNFRSSKSWGQQIAKFNCAELNVECFIVSTAAVRLELETHNRRYWDTMSTLLHSSILFDIARLNKFIEESVETLQQQTSSAKEVNNNHKKIIDSSIEMNFVVLEIVKKQKVLSNWTNEKVDKMNQALSNWENFKNMLENHQMIMKQQIDTMKSNLTAEMQSVLNMFDTFHSKWQQYKPKGFEDENNSKLKKIVEFLKNSRTEWNTLKEKKEKIINDCKDAYIDIPDFSSYDSIENDLQQLENIWGLYDEFNLGLQDIGQEKWIEFRGKAYKKCMDFILKWQEKLKEMTTSLLTIKIHNELETLKAFSLCIKYVQGETFTEKHWIEMFSIIGIPYKHTEQLKFEDFILVKDKIKEKLISLQELNTKATNEITIRQALSELDMWEFETHFSTINYVDSKGHTIRIINDFKTIFSSIGEKLCLLQSIKNTSNDEQFLDKSNVWEGRLMELDAYLRQFSHVQRKWLYLDPIFGSGALKIDKEVKLRFDRVDRDFKYILQQSLDSKVLQFLKINNIKNLLESMLNLLATTKKSLNDFLEDKRKSFPRFYFLSDEDLLEMIGQTKKVSIVQAHLKKLFSGVQNVQFNSSGNIVAIESPQNEIVNLDKPVQVSNQIEEWLKLLVQEITNTLKICFMNCLKELDPLKYPSQILCMVNEVLFSSRCEDAIKKQQLQQLQKSLKNQLDTYTALNVESSVRGENVLHLKVKSLILDTIHHISVVDELINSRVSSIHDWEWQKRIRFYSHSGGEIIIRMVDSEFTYSYEYQGISPKLVHTPLTDNCYLTLTQAMSMGFGGNPYGPAGTGKTESIKALGYLFGRQVLVFNCDEGIDIKSLTRILIGLARCGAWGCFDEFNRLEDSTLSMISTRIHPIQEAIKNKETSFVLENQKIDLNLNAGIFVTLNPAGQGYGGRNKLPDNLKQLFRPVIMSKPDQTLIANVALHAEGFKHPQTIAKKLVETFDSAKQLLSNQQHYDWGLRALKTVIGFCGTILKASAVTLKSLSEECSVAVQALELNTISKLTFDDSVLFKSLISNIFPEFKVTNNTQIYDTLTQKIRKAAEDMELQINPRQEQKCIELYEQLQQRMGVVVMGPPSTGKTTIIQLLSRALTTNNNIKIHKINPKAQSRSQLLGKVDLDTRQWIDGIISKAAQQAYSENPDIISWIIFDGDVDPEWIESLNSVLDDNRLLTLPSGWRIQFGNNINFIFETHSLKHASPATVSRMGIILLSEEDTSINNVIDSWINTFPNSNIVKDYEPQLYKAMKWLEINGQLVSSCSTISTVKNVLHLLTDVKSKSHFMICLINGLGANLITSHRDKFTTMVFEMFGEYMPETNDVKYYCYNEIRDNIEAYNLLDTENSNVFGNKIGDLIETPRIANASDILVKWIQHSKSIFVVGPSASGKSKIIFKCINLLRGIECVTIHCSAQTSPEQILLKMSQMCVVVSNNKGRIYRPKNSERLILHLKNLNHVKPDKWGSIHLAAFLQQLIFFGGFYEPATLEWMGIDSNIIIINSLTSIDGINPRLVSASNIIHIETPQKHELQKICSEYLSTVIDDKSEIITNAVVDLLVKTRETLTSVQTPHYTFTNHILVELCKNLSRYRFNDKNNAAQVLFFEANRIFNDRLVTYEDKSKFEEIIQKIYADLRLNFKYEDVVYICERKIDPKHIGSLSKVYIEEWKKIIEKCIVTNETTNQEVELNTELLYLITAYCERVLTNPSGCMLLVGRSGIGRNLAVRIVASRHNATVVFPKIRPIFNLNAFKNDLKAIMQTCGIDNEEVYYVVEEYHIVNNEVLDIVSCLIVSGEVMGLYQNEELESLCAPLKDQMSQQNFDGTPTNFFTQRVKNNLHVVMILDSESEFFNNCIENSPAVLDHSHIIWLDRWDDKTMEIIPELIFKKNKIIENFPNINEHMSYFASIHREAAAWMNTCPRRYLSFIQTFSILLTNKQESINKRMAHLKAGLSKLIDARNIVAKLKSDAGVQETKLAEKQEKANQALNMISRTMQGANTKKEQMESLRKEFQTKNDILNQRKKEIDQELAQVEPLIEESQAAVSNIKSEALTEIRSLRAPPEVIRDILEGVLRLMGIQDTSWNSMKTFLAKRGVKEDIRFFDARRISEANRDSVERLLKTKRDSFDSKNAKRASAAAAPLASWVVANVEYSHILHKIKPLETEHASLKSKLQKAEEQIELLSDGLDSVEKNVSELREQLTVNTKEAAEIELNINKEKKTIEAAQKLVEKLDDEFSRWGLQVNELSLSLENLLPSTLLASAFMTYLSECSDSIRNEKIEKWKYELKSNEFSFSKFMESERQILQWITEGLPSDETSHQNAIILKQIKTLQISAKFYPLIIDPNNNIMEWLKLKLPINSTDFTPFENPKLYSILELAVRFGKTMVIYNVSKIDPILVPVLRSDFIIEGSRKMIQIADRLVDYNENFQLYLFSNTVDLTLSSDQSVLLTIVNFTLNHIGLTEQLLRHALKVQNPKLDSMHLELLHTEEELKSKLHVLQENVLKDLAGAQGNILENQELLNSLDSIKTNSTEISKSLDDSLKVQSKLEFECQVYKPFSSYASKIYFALKDFFIFNRFCQISMATFVKLFQSTLKESTGSTNQEKRLLHTVYYYVSRSLFKDQQLTFATYLSYKLNPNDFGSNEWELFIGKKTTNIDEELNYKDNIPKWIDDNRAFDVYMLKESIPELYEKLQLDNQNIWKDFVGTTNSSIPNLVNVSSFQQVLITQALKPDKLHKVLTEFSLNQLKLADLSPSTLSLSKLVGENTEPVMIITSIGSDPSDELRMLAKQMTHENCIEIAVGEDRKEVDSLQELCKQPKWVVLKNIHLSSESLLMELEKRLKSLENVHEKFAVWMTAEPNEKIQHSLIVSCVKVAYEAPHGVKRNMRRAYDIWKNEHVVWKSSDEMRSVYALAWFHSIVLERRTYIPQGWSQYYEFNDSDLTATLKVLQKSIHREHGSTRWAYIHGLCEKAIYGGRITNLQDVAILTTYLRCVFTSDNVNWKDGIPGITELNSSDAKDVENALKSVPEQDTPKLLDLPENVDRSWQKKQSTETISQLRRVSVGRIGTKLHIKGDWHLEVQPILDLWKALNRGVNLTELPTSRSGDSNPWPVDTFFNQELNFAVRLVRNVHKTLAAVNQTIRSNTRPSTKVSDTVLHLIRLQTPKSWMDQWNGPNDPVTYIRNVVARTMSVKKINTSTDKLSQKIDLDELFHPRTLLIALKQQTAKQYEIPMNSLILDCSLSSNGLKGSKINITITNLIIEGARLNHNVLVENTADSPSVAITDDIKLAWIPQEHTNYMKNSDLQIALYETQFRDSLISLLPMAIPLNEQKKWILAGVTLFLRTH